MQETQNSFSINNYDFAQQLDFALHSDQEITLDEVTTTTEVATDRRTKPEAERLADQDNATIDEEIAGSIARRSSSTTDRV